MVKGGEGVLSLSHCEACSLRAALTIDHQVTRWDYLVLGLERAGVSPSVCSFGVERTGGGAVRWGSDVVVA